jgi:hypothetical protein
MAPLDRPCATSLLEQRQGLNLTQLRLARGTRAMTRPMPSCAWPKGTSAREDLALFR